MEFVCEGVKDVPPRKQQTQQKLATLMGVSKTTVQRWIVASTIHVHSNSLKPIWRTNGSSLPQRRSATSLSQTRRTQSIALNTNLTSQR